MNYDFETEIKIFAQGKKPVNVTSTLERTNLNNFWNHDNKGYDQTYFIYCISHAPQPKDRVDQKFLIFGFY